MISFSSPWLLLLLIPVALLPLQSRITGQNRLVVADLSSMKRRFSPRVWLSPLPRLLQMLGLGLAVVALARPVVIRKDVWVESEGLDIILAIDASGSMRAEDFTQGLTPVNRLQVAKGVMEEFVKMRPNDRIGLVVFGEEAFTQVPLTLDHDTLQDMVDRVEIGIAGAQGTAVGTAIAVSAKRLKDLESKSKIVILLTDGRSNAGRIQPMEAAQAAAALGIKVYTIGVGAPQRALFGMMDDGPDEQGMMQISETTNAKFFRATDTQSLRKIYETINQLEPSPAKVIQLVDHDERFRTFLVPALLFFLGQVGLSTTLLRKGPVSWAQPDWLLGLLTLPPLLLLMAIAGWMHRWKLGRVLSKDMLARVVPRSVRVRRTLRDLALLLATAALFVALAEPRFDKQVRTLQSKGTDVVLLLDLSRSMDARDVDPSRLERARREIEDLGRQIEGDRIGLVVFAGGAYPRLPLTADFKAVELVVGEASTDTFDTQGSNLGAAIRTGIDLLDKSQEHAGQALLILSDGETHGASGGADDALAAAKLASDRHVPIFAMGIGEEPAPIPLPDGRFLQWKGATVTSTPDFDTLKQVAKLTGGGFVASSAGSKDMEQLYGEIRRSVKAVERSSQQRETYRSAFQVPLGLGVALLLVAAWLGEGRPRIRARAALAVALLGLGLTAAPARADDPLLEADQLYRQGKFPLAVEKLVELSLEHPDDPDILQRLGAARYRAGDYEGSARAFDQASQLEQSPESLFDAGNAEYQAGRLEDAKNRYEQVLAEDPDNAPAKQNHDLVVQELEARRTAKPPPPPQGGGGDQDKPQPKPNPSDPQPKPQPGKGQPGQPQPGDPNAPKDPSQTPQPGTPSNDKPDGKDPSKAVSPDQVKDPQDQNGQPSGSTTTANGERGGPITAGQAERLLDSVDEGNQRMVFEGKPDQEPW